MVFKDLFYTSLMMKDIRVFVDEKLVHDDSYSKRYITFSKYYMYEVIDIIASDRDVSFYLSSSCFSPKEDFSF